jgi:hypothetical protein
VDKKQDKIDSKENNLRVDDIIDTELRSITNLIKREMR